MIILIILSLLGRCERLLPPFTYTLQRAVHLCTMRSEGAGVIVGLGRAK